MIQLTYVSEASHDLTSDELFKIIEASSRNNLRDELTGFLIFAKNRFFQLIEGPQDQIEALVTRLNRDPRHRAIRIVNRQQIAERAFPRWHMKRLEAGSELWRALPEGVWGEGSQNRLKEDLASFLGQDAPVRA